MEMATDVSEVTCLTGLPAELFAEIIAAVLEAVGMLKAVRLRVISKKFDTAIVYSIYNSYLHDKDGPVYIQLARRIRVGTNIHPRMMGVFLLAEMDRNPSNDILFPIWDAIQAFHKETEQEIQSRTKRLVCEAMSQHLFWSPCREIGFRCRRLARSGSYIERQPSPQIDEDMQIALSIAIVVNDLSRSQHLLAKYPNVNFFSRYFGRPLQLAAKWAGIGVVQLLLNHGADPSVDQIFIAGPAGQLDVTHGLYYSTRGYALQVAALAGKDDVVRLLLDPRYSKNLSADAYSKSIECAARTGHIRIISLLMGNLVKGSQIPESEMLERVFFIACYHGREELAKLMLEKGVKVNSLNTRLSGYPSALQIAAIHGRVNVLRLLLDRGIDRDFSSARNGGPKINAFTFSAARGYEDAVQVFLDHGADLNARSSGVDLEEVARRSQARMLEFLLKQGADLKRLSDDGKTTIGEKMLLDTVREGYLPVVQILIRAGVPMNNPDRPLDPVLNAKAYGKNHVLEALLKLGAQEVDEMSTCFAADFRSGRYPLQCDQYTSRWCHWLGRY